MVDLDADAHQYRLDEIEGLKADIDRLIAKCFEQHEYIEQLEAAQGRLKEALRVNMIRYADAYVSHEDIDALIDAALTGVRKDD